MLVRKGKKPSKLITVLGYFQAGLDIFQVVFTLIFVIYNLFSLF